ncbi:hypothetical protein V1525DRAFT_359017 [Lipomyces kononenkoae]|uniref:Uncharacterized protein n=1 Tax=Lipomyces kononenkoae TaxID=34357 RepID=A0ACC3T2U6_LIPKO
MGALKDDGSFSGDDQNSRAQSDNYTSSLLERTLARARNLNDQVNAFANGLTEATSPGQELHNSNPKNENGCKYLNEVIWTVGPDFIRKFQIRIRKELESLETVRDSSVRLCNGLDDHEVLHRLRSTNLPHLEAIWEIFAAGQFAGIVSLGSSTKSDVHGGYRGGYRGDLIADYGAHVIKISRVNIQQLRRQISSLKVELTEDTDNLRTRDWIPYLQEYKVAQKLASAVAKPTVEDTLLMYNGLKVLRPPRDFNRQVTIALCHKSDCEEDIELLEMIKAEFELGLRVNVQLFDLKQVETISTSELVNRNLANDTRYFSCQVPSVLNFDVTGLLCIVSDISNLNFDQSETRLELQRSLAHVRHKKSENAFAFLKKQLEAERYYRVRRIIVSLIRGTPDLDRRILTCSSGVRDKFLDMVAKMGSSDEKRRAQLLFDSDETLRIDREAILPGIPDIIVLDHTPSICDGAPMNEELTDCGMCIATEFCRTRSTGFMMVTANFKMAKQLRSKLDGVFSKGILVVEPRSLLGGA